MFNLQTEVQLKKMGINPNDPDVVGRQIHPTKGTFKSLSRDPWMQTAFNINRAFLGWLVAQRRQSKGMSADLPNLKAEIRNDFVRARDLWEEFLASKGEITPLTTGFQPARVVPTAAMNANYQAKRGVGGTKSTSGLSSPQDLAVNNKSHHLQQGRPQYLTHEYLDALEAQNLNRAKELNRLSNILLD